MNNRAYFPIQFSSISANACWWYDDLKKNNIHVIFFFNKHKLFLSVFLIKHKEVHTKEHHRHVFIDEGKYQDTCSKENVLLSILFTCKMNVNAKFVFTPTPKHWYLQYDKCNNITPIFELKYKLKWCIWICFTMWPFIMREQQKIHISVNYTLQTSFISDTFTPTQNTKLAT